MTNLEPPAAAAQPDLANATTTATRAELLRFEDLTQDGRLVLEALPNALGPLVWRGMLPRDPFVKRCHEEGIVAILTRFVVQAFPGPFAASATLEARAGYRIALSEAGPLMLDVSGEIHAPIGRTYSGTSRDGERALAGHVFAEHTFTRLFAPQGKRRVTRADLTHLPPVTLSRPASPTPESIASLPAGAVPLEAAPRLDSVPITFGIVHTDSNMHVNSLIYFRMFEEAALRRFRDLGRDVATVLGRRLEIAYRKPCFAGQTMRVRQQAFEHDGRLGMVATLVADDRALANETPSLAKPHTLMRMTFEG